MNIADEIANMAIDLIEDHEERYNNTDTCILFITKAQGKKLAEFIQAENCFKEPVIPDKIITYLGEVKIIISDKDYLWRY